MKAIAPKDRFKILEFTNPRTGSLSWRVTGTKRTGERVRENYPDATEAKNRQIALHVEYAARVPEESAVQATRLSDSQIKIAEAAFTRLDKDEDMLIAVDQWLRGGRKKAPTESPRVDDAVNQYLTWLDASTFRDATKRNWKNRMTVFRDKVENVRVCDIDPDFIDKFLAGRGTTPGGKDTDKRAVSRFFSWCIERPRRWTTSNPCREVKIDMGESAPPSVLSVKDCEKLLRAAEKHKRGLLVPYVAACLFAGIRPFEASRLTRQQVNVADKEIRLEANQTKDGRARVVTMNATLRKWLLAYKGEFYPANWRKEFDAVREAAGITEWPHDVLRHTAISHYFRQTGSYGQSADQFGNSEAIIKKHYNGRVSSADTERFYALVPDGKKARKPKMKKAKGRKV